MAPSASDVRNPEASANADECLHCGGELGRGWVPEEGPFCCRGCRSVYALIHDSGLDRYYDLRSGQQPPAARLAPESFAWLDSILERRAAETGDAPLRLTLDLQGIHCAACIWLLEELFRREPAGLALRINPALGRAELCWDTSRGDLREYLREAERCGYRFGPARRQPAGSARGLLGRMAISVALALNVMMFSLSYYFGLAPADGALYELFGRLSLLLASASVLIGGQVFFRAAWAGLRRGLPHLDLPISLGMALAYLGSLYAYFTGGPEAAYFDSLTLFVALMLIGRWAQEHVLERNRNALLDASGAEQFTVRRQCEAGLESVPATAVRRGDELWVAPGDLLPCSAILTQRPATLALDWITGESESVIFAPGDRLPAGAFNAGRSGFRATATEEFADSELGALLAQTDGMDDGSRLSRWWARVSRFYVFGVLALASAGLLLWLALDASRALEVTVAILVVTCPCALGLATPLAEELIHHALRRRGVFLRKSGFLDRALSLRKILFDKTGTLTLGRLALDPESLTALARLGGRERAALRFMTERSNHPVSRCLAAAFESTEGDDAGPERPADAEAGLAEIPGEGLQWLDDGVAYRLGRAGFAMEDAGLAAQEGSTLFSLDGRLLASFTLNEKFKADARAEIETLGMAGYEIHLLSGDGGRKVALAAAQLGIPAENARGGLSPADKADEVRRLDRRDTLMVGDGINDSPSFAAAYCSATPAVDRAVLPGKADFYFLGDGIAAIRRALAAAGRLRAIIRLNLGLALLYNGVAVALCLAGLVTPVLAAILMPLSSLGVVGITLYRLSGRRLAWMS